MRLTELGLNEQTNAFARIFHRKVKMNGIQNVSPIMDKVRLILQLSSRALYTAVRPLCGMHRPYELYRYVL